MNPPVLAQLYGTCIRNGGNDPACGQFFDNFRPVMTRVVSKLAWQYNAPGEIEDLLQEVSLKLLASGESILAGLPKESNSAEAYFSVLAVNAARDVFRLRGAKKRGVAATVSYDAPSSEFLATLGRAQTQDRELLLQQIESHLPDDRREQTVFRLYYRQGYSAREISELPFLQLTVKGVESMIFRITNSIREKVTEGKGISGGKAS